MKFQWQIFDKIEKPAISEHIMKVGFMFPNNDVSRYVAARLVESNFRVEFFCPERLDVEAASSIISELSILGWERNRLDAEDEAFRKAINILNFL